MAVRVKFELLIPGFDTVDQLRDYVVAHDELLSGDEPAIAHEHVKAEHVLELYFTAHMPQLAYDEGRIPTGYPVEVIEVDELEEA